MSEADRLSGLYYLAWRIIFLDIDDMEVATEAFKAAAAAISNQEASRPRKTRKSCVCETESH